MRSRWRPQAWKEYLRLQRTDKATAAKIDRLLADIEQSPFSGLGKPEWLHHRQCWGRRINKKDRLLYNVIDDVIHVYACGEHYDDH